MATICLVKAPDDRSHSRCFGIFLVSVMVRFPDTSRADLPDIVTASSSISVLKLSSIIWSGFSPAASSSSISVSTSTMIFFSGASVRALSMAAVIPPHAAT